MFSLHEESLLPTIKCRLNLQSMDITTWFFPSHHLYSLRTFTLIQKYHILLILNRWSGRWRVDGSLQSLSVLPWSDHSLLLLVLHDHVNFTWWLRLSYWWLSKDDLERLHVGIICSAATTYTRVGVIVCVTNNTILSSISIEWWLSRRTSLTKL